MIGRKRREMQAVLDAAWARSRQDPEIRAAWDRYFPDGKKPTLKQFIDRIAAEVRSRT